MPAAHAHSHRHPTTAPTASSAASKAVIWVLGVIAVLVLVAMLLCWPNHQVRPSGGLSGQLVSATVRTSQLTDCGPGGANCQVGVSAELTSGPDAGKLTTLTFASGPTDPRLRVGDHIRLARAVQDGQVLYQFDDISRGRPLLLLTLGFCLVVLVVGRWRGLAALAGLGFAGLVLVAFLLPALVAGQSPILVAVLAGAAITLVALPLSHGLSLTTGVAMLGTLVGMSVAALVAEASIASLRITGLSGEENATLSLRGSHSTVGGLLLAGAVVGALGVLNDVTVTQSSAAAELAAGGAQRQAVWRSAMRIGRDHIASTVYSLVLAYAGSALPLLLLFSLSQQSILQVLTSDALAPEIATSLIGGIALVLVVPLTTALAASICYPQPPQRPPDPIGQVG